MPARVHTLICPKWASDLPLKTQINLANFSLVDASSFLPTWNKTAIVVCDVIKQNAGIPWKRFSPIVQTN
jgi:hypothetical protein